MLNTSTSTDAAKLASLKFLGHWMGELHQPLHVSFEDDRGGGKIRESGPCSNNLHSVWDTCIIEKKLGTDWRSIGLDLSEVIAASDRATWTATKVEVWAGESYAIAREKDTEYCVIVGNRCVYEAGNETYDTGETEKVVVVDDAHLERQEPIVTERLKRAGVRLAHLLNTTLGK